MGALSWQLIKRAWEYWFPQASGLEILIELSCVQAPVNGGDAEVATEMLSRWRRGDRGTQGQAWA